MKAAIIVRFHPRSVVENNEAFFMACIYDVVLDGLAISRATAVGLRSRHSSAAVVQSRCSCQV